MARSLKTLFPTANAVLLEGDQTISGVKEFGSSPIVPTPTTATQAVNKGYIDTICTPIFICMITKVPDAIGQGTWDIIQQSSHMYGGFFRNALGAADGDNFSVNFNVVAGTYRIDCNIARGSNKGIIDIIVDTTTVLSAADMYFATDDVLTITSATGIALTSGSHTLKYAVNGKNASSSSYVLNISGIQISRTGD